MTLLNFFRKPVFWVIVAITAAFIALPLWHNDVGLRESLVLASVYIILASNLNLMIGYAGYVNFGSIVFFGLGGYIAIFFIIDYGCRVAWDREACPSSRGSKASGVVNERQPGRKA